MTQEQKDKIAKVYELVNRGEAGEKEAAKKALDRLMKKYNLNDADIEGIKLTKYQFKYSNNLEQWLLSTIVTFFLDKDNVKAYRKTYKVREVVLALEYLDFIVVESAYGYFRKHMMAQYKKMVLPQVNRCRTVKTKNARRAELQEIFFSNYVIASNLYKPQDLTEVKLSDLSEKERKQRAQLQGVQGGNYKTQVTNGLYLE